LFSFGTLCLWVIFEKYLSAVVALPPEAHWADQYFQFIDKKDLSKEFLSEMKRKDRLILLAEQLLFAESGLPAETKDGLRQFFSIALRSRPEERADDLMQCFSFNSPDE
jgi:hypothetical protein